MTKLFDDAVAKTLLTFPYWVEVFTENPDPTPEELALADRMAEKLARIQQPCTSCAEQRARAEAARRNKAS